MMSSVLILILAMSIWGAIHSFLASLTVKSFFQRYVGFGFMRFYRLIYNGFSLISFLPILWLTVVLPDRPLYQVPLPWSLLLLAGQGFAVILLLVGVLQTGPLSFAGVRQLFEEERPASLVTSGLYRYVRHPLYTAGLLFLWLTPTMTLNRLTLYLVATLYILIGAIFEERKLLGEFGEAYARYQRSTPMLIPRWNREK
jgi:protein-S-isoprenylcysteine O-methyltransferase Ste14